MDLLPLLICDGGDIAAGDNYRESLQLGWVSPKIDATEMDWTFAEMLENEDVDI